MRLLDALRISEVERKLDGKRDKPAARRIKYQFDNRRDQYVVAYSQDFFQVVWADTLKVIYTLSFVHYNIHNHDDWEPM